MIKIELEKGQADELAALLKIQARALQTAADACTAPGERVSRDRFTSRAALMDEISDRIYREFGYTEQQIEQISEHADGAI